MEYGVCGMGKKGMRSQFDFLANFWSILGVRYGSVRASYKARVGARARVAVRARVRVRVRVSSTATVSNLVNTLGLGIGLGPGSGSGVGLGLSFGDAIAHAGPSGSLTQHRVLIHILSALEAPLPLESPLP